MPKLAIYLAILVLGSNLSSSNDAKRYQPKPVQAPITAEEQRFVDLVNSERVAMGLSRLVIDPVLVEVARGHSKEMCDKSYFGHYSPAPERRTAVERYTAAVDRRSQWSYVGENLFYCSIVDVSRGHTRLMESRTHKENIINPRFNRIGVGVHIGDDGGFWVTQMFLAERVQ